MKKRILAFVLASVLTVSVTGCGNKKKKEAKNREQELVETTASKDEEENDSGKNLSEEDSQKKQEVQHLTLGTQEIVYNSNKRANASTTFDVPVFIYDSDAKTYPELQKAFSDYTERIKTDEERVYQNLVTAIESDYDSTGGNLPYERLYDERRMTLTRTDENLVSFRIDSDYYEGGAHSLKNQTGVTFDTETGKELTISDVVKDKESFLRLLQNKVKEEYPDEYGQIEHPDEFFRELAEQSEQEIDWYMDSESLVVIWNSFALNAGDVEIQRIHFFLDECKDYLDSKYLQIPEDYIIPLDLNNYKADINGDGKREEVRISGGGTNSEEIYYNTIECGDKKLELKKGAFDTVAYLAHTGGKYYMMVFEGMGAENSTHISIVDLEEMSCDEEKAVYAVQRNTYTESRNLEDRFLSVNTYLAFMNPADICLDTRMDMLSTYQGYREYYIDNHGNLTAKSEDYIPNIKITLLAKQDISCHEVTEDGVIGEETILPKNTVVQILRTDGSTWADIQPTSPEGNTNIKYGEGTSIYDFNQNLYDKNEKIYRIYVDLETWPHTVNGVSEEDVFQGGHYAG